MNTGNCCPRYLLYPYLLLFFFLFPCITSAENHTWSVSSAEDFHDGIMGGTDSWSNSGSVQLDKRWSAATRVNNPATDGRDIPRLASKISGPNSNFFMVWEDEQNKDHYPDIRFKVFNFISSTWVGEKLIRAHDDAIRQKSPDIAVRSSDAYLWVVWQQDSGSSGNDGDIYYATSSDDGQNWSMYSAVYTGAGDQITPRIARDKSSGSHIMYTVWKDERTDDGDIYITRSTGVSPSWTAPFKISDDTGTGEQQTPAIATDSSGNVYVVWHDTRDNSNGEIYFSSYSSGSSWASGSWSANSKLSDNSAQYALTSPSIATGPGDIIYAAWAERVSTGPATYDFQIRVAKSEDQGSTWSSTVVDRLEGASAGNNSYNVPAVEVDSSGKLYIAWLNNVGQQAADGDIYFSISPDGGTNWSEPTTISGVDQDVKTSTIPAIAVSQNSHVLVAWDDYRNTYPDIYAASYPGLLYVATGTYSKTLDAQKQARWGSISWTETLPSGTNLALESRVRNSEDESWSSWLTHSSSGEEVTHDSSRYFQFRATLSTSVPNTTPSLDSLELSYQTTGWHLFMPAIFSGRE